MDHRLDQTWDDDEIDLADVADCKLGALTLSPSSREVRWTGGREIVQPRVMQALVCLAQADGAVVSRDELVRRCWGGRIVGEDAINRCIAKARQLAEAAGGAPAFFIETIPRVGYRLRRTDDTAAPAGRGAPSRTWLIAGAAACVPVMALGLWLVSKPAPAAPDAAPPMRSVAVLPIQNLTGDPTLEPAVDRLTEDITYVVGRTGYISVPPRTATFALKGKAVDERALGRTLGVRNVVIGSLRKEETGYRVNYQMVDTATGQVVDTKDLGVARPGRALPEPQLALAVYEQISDAIDHRWTAAELAKPVNDRDPENVMARLNHMMKDWAAGRPSIAETQRLIATAASEIKPDSPLAAEFGTMACWSYLGMIEGGYAKSQAQRDAWARLALDYGRQATAIRPDVTGAHGCRAEVFGQLGEWDAGLSEAQYIIDTYPLATTPYEARGEAEMARGRFADAVRDFTEVDERGGESASAVGVARLFQHQDAAAIEALQARTAVDPMDADAYFFLSAAYELTGNHRDALAAAESYRRVRRDSSAWRTLELSREPAYLTPARTIRSALHTAGLDEPASPLG